MPPATLPMIYFLTFLSGRRKQPHLANQRHVPALRGGQRPGAAPGRQEAQIQHQDQEQQLVTKVQRNIPIVSRPVSYVLRYRGTEHTHSIHLHIQPKFCWQWTICILQRNPVAPYIKCDIIPIIHQCHNPYTFKKR